VPQAKVEPLEEPQHRSEADLRGHLQNDGGENGAASPGAKKPPAGEQSKSPPPADAPATAAAPTEPPKFKPPTPAEAAAADYQLQRALDLLRGVSLFSARAGN
jgi:carboxyl-terminal processing protease